MKGICSRQHYTTKTICHSESKWSFDTIFCGNVTKDNYLALKLCQIDATAVASAQLW